VKYKPLYFTGRSLTRILFGLLLRIKVTGAENVPLEGGLIIASNHISYFDPPVVGSFVKRETFFFAKDKLFEIPVFGRVISRVNASPVKRGTIDRDALEWAVATITAGKALVVFPEGTRAREGKFLSPKSGVGMMAIRAGCPIVPVYVHGLNKFKACLLGKEKPLITYGEPLSADWVHSFPDTRESYKQIAQQVMERIAGLRDRTLAPKGN
jgi:1-acyl-sn-glycerol-3-phosphate acyltransferase